MKEIFVAGAISVKAVVESDKRDVICVYCTEKKYKTNRDIRYIISLCEKKEIKHEFVGEEFFDIPSLGKNHGCICARIESCENRDIDIIFQDKDPFIIYIDGIEDPYNLGDSIRSAYASGATAIILPDREWEDALGTIIRSSAGATEKIKIVYSDDLEGIVSRCHEANIKVIAATRKDAISIYDADLGGPVLMMIGGEKRGLSSSKLSLADVRIYIPYGNDFRNSLSTSSSVSVVAFEALRQRKKQVSHQ